MGEKLLWLTVPVVQIGEP